MARDTSTAQPRRVHGEKGVYYAGCFVDMEDIGKEWNNPKQVCSGDRRARPPPPQAAGYDCDVLIIGAGCVGASVARELARYQLRVVLMEGSDDVTQGATKGNSGIVHAGFDDTPGSRRAQFCWKGNQMFTQLDKELRFGLQRNGSLVVARSAEDEETLRELMERGRKNGVQRLRIVQQAELREMEPAIARDATAALYSPDAATLTPYEFTIALAENAVDNGVELRLSSRVTAMAPLPGGGFAITARVSERGHGSGGASRALVSLLLLLAGLAFVSALAGALVLASPGHPFLATLLASAHTQQQQQQLPAPRVIGSFVGAAVAVAIALGAAASLLSSRSGGPLVSSATLRARFVVNAAGVGSGDIAKLVGDNSFYIKPRIGEYLLLHKKEGAKARHILFPAPGKMGKGVLVQTTLWGNLILGPTAADTLDPSTAKRTTGEIMLAILARCRDLVPSFDAGEVIHSFSGLRAKSSRGDWIIERCATAPDLVHAAGIDSPGLAGSPAIALEVVSLLKAAGLPTPPNPTFNPNRRPIILPKDSTMLRAAHINDDGTVTAIKMKVDGDTPGCNIICKCEKVLESEIVDAIHRSLPCGSTQAVRKRTRAGMGHCQAEFCEDRVKAVIARETRTPLADVPGRPWPATSILPARWLDEKQKEGIREIGLGDAKQPPAAVVR